MKRLNLAAGVLLLTAASSIPALAAWDRIGWVDVSYRVDRDNASPNFGGPVERLMFTARGSDIHCGYIRATFRNGRTRELMSGKLKLNDSRPVDLPGISQDVRRLSFKCHALDRRSARIEIAADIGHYRDTWRKSSDWSRVWSRVFTWH